jgi:osmoprotectant transport system substrate-binding protein
VTWTPPVGKAARMSLRRRFFPFAVSLGVVGLVAAGCGGSSDTEKAAGGTQIVVGSFGFTESETLAQIYGGALKNAGAEVTYKLKLGNREVVAPALESGAIDLVPEYVGNYLAYLDKTQTKGLPLADAVSKTKALATAKNLTIGEVSEATDGDVLAVTKDLANSKGLAKISDLSKLGSFKLAGPTECETRETCLLGLKSTYSLGGVTFLSTAADAGGPITKTALTDGKAQVGRLFSSDPDLAKSGKFVVLEDDKSYQQAGNIIPVIRTGKATDALVKVLDKVSKALTNEKLLELNKKTDIDKEDPAKVAADFLVANKL